MRTMRVGLAAILCFIALFLEPFHGKAATAATFTDFAQAIRANDLTALRKLASSPAAANVTERLKSTPLHYAALYGSPEAVDLLLDAGADPKARTQSGATPLIYAAWGLEKTRLFVEHGAEVNAAENGGVTALMVAVSAHDNIATVRYLIERGADVRAVDKLRSDALIRAAFLSDPDILQLLLVRGADPHLTDMAGFSALNGALSYSDPERVRALVRAGADPNNANTFAGMVKKGPIALIHLTPLILAAPYGEVDTVSTLLEAGARVNEPDSRKLSPLMLSIATDHANPATVRRLIAANADVNAKDQNGESVLTWARKFRNPEILAALEGAGAKGPELPAPPQPAPGSQPANASEAVGRALPLLARSGPQFFSEGGCPACHHQTIHAQVFVAAIRAGLQPDPSLRQTFLDSITASRPRILPNLPLLRGPGGDYDTLLSYLMSLADLGEPANEYTDLITHYVAVRQDPCGAWINLGIARPPIEDSTITRTAMAIRALKTYTWPARQAEFDARIRRAREWLQNAKPVTTYEAADRITGLRAAGASTSDLREDAAALLHLERPDGGWAQTPYLDSDAYATGLVLHTLYASGLLAPTDEPYQKGVAFLLRTQFPDGSWYVRSRSPKFQPYFQSGFPFDHDQWISSAATSLAVMALAPVSGVQQRASR